MDTMLYADEMRFYEVAIHNQLFSAWPTTFTIQQGIIYGKDQSTPDDLKRDGVFDMDKDRSARYQSGAIRGIDFHGHGLGYYYKARYPTEAWVE
ncbi:hypothetical protein QQZ08_007534 [Neonectria magnoliae]|uniref:Uncharacterized protein n=1 Tax=Neonectria magnoliae TaxID=2732573 RepID=A0ABR1HXK7_9HYPO